MSTRIHFRPALMLCLGICLSLNITATQAETRSENSNQNLSAMENQAQDLKKEILELNRDLFVLEEELLFPANTQFTVFLSVDKGKLFNLDSVQLRLNDKVVANHLYTDQELQALLRGGVQRIYMGNLPSGRHELVAYFNGTGPRGRDFRRGTTIALDKSSSPKFVELKITDDSSKQQPKFDVKVWE